MLEVCSELYVRVNGVDVLEELVAVFCLLGDRGVIHIPEPQSWGGVGSSV